MMLESSAVIDVGSEIATGLGAGANAGARTPGIHAKYPRAKAELGAMLELNK